MKKFVAIVAVIAMAGSMSSCKKCIECVDKDSSGQVVDTIESCGNKAVVNTFETQYETLGYECTKK